MKKIILKQNGVIIDEIMLPEHDEMTIAECVEGGLVLAQCDYVDLGLPSGILWATCNMGAKVPGDFGDYYAWGELIPRGFEDWISFEEVTYSLRGVKCYGDNNELLPEYDVATQKLGEKWRYPTHSELIELSKCCVWKEDTEANSQGEEIRGYRVLSKFNGNSIFLPAAGCRSGTRLDNDTGNYFSKSIGYRTWYGQPDIRYDKANCLYFGFGTFKERLGSHYVYWAERYMGLSIRPVRVP